MKSHCYVGYPSNIIKCTATKKVEKRGEGAGDIRIGERRPL